MNNLKINESDIIFKTSAHDEKFYVREQKGPLQRIRRVISFILLGMFILLPWLSYQGKQAIYFDVAAQKLHLFSQILFPSDLFIFCLIFMLAAFGLFYVTKLYGRVWCGFVCPQTIWTLMFNWVERRIEGSHNKSKALDKQSLNVEKVIKKSTKHILWMLISIITALVFMSYFAPAKDIYVDFITFELSSTMQAWVWFFAVCTYTNAGWMKDKMCLHVCPYARFQSAMFDKSTSIITYDYTRGEGRGKRKIGQPKQENQGDCVDCNLCVQVCPVGIDIRNGLQYECISCGLCIDACDMTMKKFQYETGLIKFSKEAKTSNKKRHLGYGSAIAITLVTIMAWQQQRVEFDLSITRDRQALYRVNNDGHIENTYTFKIRNKTSEPANYMIEAISDEYKTTGGATHITVNSGDLLSSTLSIASLHAPKKKRENVEFRITSLSSNAAQTQKSPFYSPGL